MDFTKEQLDSMPVPPGKIVFLGSNPSCSSPYIDPFSHCKSANRIINEWILALGLTRDEVHFMNVANYKTERNRPLKTKEILKEVDRLDKLLAGQIVITLGKAAAFAMKLVAGRHFERGWFPRVIDLPHPSGRNRILNDKKHVQTLLQQSQLRLQEIRRGQS